MAKLNIRNKYWNKIRNMVKEHGLKVLIFWVVFKAVQLFLIFIVGKNLFN